MIIVNDDNTLLLSSSSSLSLLFVALSIIAMLVVDAVAGRYYYHLVSKRCLLGIWGALTHARINRRHRSFSIPVLKVSGKSGADTLSNKWKSEWKKNVPYVYTTACGIGVKRTALNVQVFTIYMEQKCSLITRYIYSIYLYIMVLIIIGVINDLSEILGKVLPSTRVIFLINFPNTTIHM